MKQQVKANEATLMRSVYVYLLLYICKKLCTSTQLKIKEVYWTTVAKGLRKWAKKVYFIVPGFNCTSKYLHISQKLQFSNPRIFLPANREFTLNFGYPLVRRTQLTQKKTSTCIISILTKWRSFSQSYLHINLIPFKRPQIFLWW